MGGDKRPSQNYIRQFNLNLKNQSDPGLQLLASENKRLFASLNMRPHVVPWFGALWYMSRIPSLILYAMLVPLLYIFISLNGRFYKSNSRNKYTRIRDILIYAGEQITKLNCQVNLTFKFLYIYKKY